MCVSVPVWSFLSIFTGGLLETPPFFKLLSKTTQQTTKKAPVGKLETPPILFHSLKLLQKHRNALWGVPLHCQQHLGSGSCSTEFCDLFHHGLLGEFLSHLGAVLDKNLQKSPMKSSSLEWTRDFQSLRAPSHEIHHLHKNTIYTKTKSPSCYMFNGKYIFKVMCRWLIVFMFIRVFH